MENRLSCDRLKKQQRIDFLEKRASLSSLRKSEASHLAQATLIQELARFNAVLSFSSIRGEIEMSGVNRHLIERGALLLPRVEARGELSFFRPTTDGDLERSSLGILEPKSICERVAACQIPLALVPALAFDSSGYRLGYGGGYYDRLLSSSPHLQSWGIGFREQLTDSLPLSHRDRPVNRLFLF